MTISTRRARLIRQGIEAARLPHRLRAWWRFDGPYSNIVMDAFERERIKAEQHTARNATCIRCDKGEAS